MKLGRWIRLVLAAALAVATLGSGIVSLAADAPLPASQAFVEPELQAALAADGQANLFVVFREQADLSAAQRMGWEKRGQFVYEALAKVAERSQAKVRELLDAERIPYTSYSINNSLYIPNCPAALADRLLRLPQVSYLRIERVYPLPEPIRDPSADAGINATTAWGLTDTKATSVWGLGYKGAGIKVANIDTGVQYNHPALDQSFACPGSPTNAACWYDPGNYCGTAGACDNNGHGTHTMGTMVGDDDPTLTYNVGMAPDATWIACKGCGTNSCSDSDLTACANWILAPGGSTANRPDIVNNSWGGGGGDTWYLSYVNSWRAAGIFPAFSAGNSGSSCSTLGSPGDYQESFATAAHDSGRTIAYFSSRGPSGFGHDPYTKPNVSAPGVNVCSTVPGSAYDCTYSGTSMASPHTAGAVALIWQACPTYRGNIDATFQLLQSTADAAPAGNCGSPGDGGNYTYGYGYLNALAAVNVCEGGGTPEPTVTPTVTPPQPILVVDDDLNLSYQSYFTAALDALGKGYDTWNVYTQGSPSLATLQAHQVVIWLTGNDYSTTLTTTDTTNLATYLDGGGKLFISGQDIGYDINTSTFFGNYLHASYVADDTNVTTLTGADIMAGVNLTITGGDGASNQSYPSAIGLGTGAVGLYDYTGTTYTWGALRWEGTYRVVYFAFGFEAISAAATRATVMDKVLTWLGSTPNGAPVADPISVTTDEDAFVGVTLTGSDPEGDSLTFSVSAQPTHGSLSGSAPALTYTPFANYNGSDSFAYVANDGHSNSAPALVSITIVAVNDLPVANAQAVTTQQDTAVAITLSATDVDGDVLVYTIETSPAHGTLSGSGASQTYTPDAGYTGADAFTFKANDAFGASNVAEVSITVTATPQGDVVWLSLAANGTLGSLGTVNDEDIVALNTATGAYSWVFDGSDVGITGDVDAFDVLDNGHILMSFDASTSVTGVGTVTDADIVEFAPTSLGSTTAGTFTWKFDASDVGLSTTNEDVDAVFFLSDGTMLVSTRASFSVTGASGTDADLIRFTPTTWGSTTAGAWSWYVDASDVGLSTTNEDVDGLWLDQSVTPYPAIYLSTLGAFSVTGASGQNEDIVIFTPTALGSTTSGSFAGTLFLDGSLFGLSSYDVDGFDVQQ